MRERHPERQAGRPKVSYPLILSIAVGAAACVTAWEPVVQTYHRTSAIADVELIGTEECEVCHDQVGGYALAPAFHSDCEACHGPGSAHEESEAPTDIRYPSNPDCLACHESGRSTHLAWATSEHSRAGLYCTDCHNPHNRELSNLRRPDVVRDVALGHLDGPSELCVSCHADVASRFTLPSHHPVGEGMLSCTDCHSPHDDRRVMLGDRTQLCSSCHQDHAGPWVWEHAPVAEDCTNCHNPHGAASYNLLDTSQPALCLSCHSWPDEAHLTQTGEGLSAGDPISPLAAGAFFTRCSDCHSAVHGSYEEPFLFR
jgi:DmsE family decaheme c-type cytochrome